MSEKLTLVSIPEGGYITCNFCNDDKYEGDEIFIKIIKTADEKQPTICKNCIRKIQQEMIMRKGGS